ncbi:hypothetical protein CRG98_000306 [Punica granatum]|uniref:Uncharacterized protein n=1 Tax=Punica granatum TaxID=22663 RepID=A0A2I0LF29_PUNGR|nr:hypothetical protein CRG98_000306 [Punica granatum]
MAAKAKNTSTASKEKLSDSMIRLSEVPPMICGGAGKNYKSGGTEMPQRAFRNVQRGGGDAFHGEPARSHDKRSENQVPSYCGIPPLQLVGGFPVHVPRVQFRGRNCSSTELSLSCHCTDLNVDSRQGPYCALLDCVAWEIVHLPMGTRDGHA